MTISLTTPSKLRELQIKLYRKAKSEFPVQSRSTVTSAMKWRLSSEPSFVSLAVKPVGKPDAGNLHVRLCVQRMLACSVGGESHRGKSQKPRNLDSKEEGN